MNQKPKIAILVKQFITTDEIREHYKQPLIAMGVDPSDLYYIPLKYDEYKKVSAATYREYIPKLQAKLDKYNITACLVCDAKYLKAMARNTDGSNLPNVSNLAGIDLDNKTGSQRLIKGRLHTSYKYDDQAKIRQQISFDTLLEIYNGTKADKEILKDARFPKTLPEIKKQLDFLLTKPYLAFDIETYGLELDVAGIGTIGFAWSNHDGVAFPCDYQEDYVQGGANWPVRKLIKEFFIAYKGQLRAHGVGFDTKHTVANAFMNNDLLDYKNMVDGLEVMFRNTHCTNDIAYLATNNAVRNTLDLKHLALPFTGKYAIDVTDITKHPVDVVLEYNLIDCCATNWVYDKYVPKLIERKQQWIYNNILRKFQRTKAQIELVGMPLRMNKVLELRTELRETITRIKRDLAQTDPAKLCEMHNYRSAHAKYQDSVKGDGRTFENFYEWKKKVSEHDFNVGSGAHLRWVVYDHYNIPIEVLTKGKQAATDKDTLHAIMNTNQDNQELYDFLKLVEEFNDIKLLYGTFTKAFILKSIKKKDGRYWLHGNLNQGKVLCLTADTLFTTPIGYRRLSQLSVGDLVLTGSGRFRPIAAIGDNGEQLVYRVWTEDGRVLTTTGNHPYLIDGNWVNAEDLKVGDNVTTHHPSLYSERWTDIPDWPMYEVSSFGRVRNKELNRILKPHPRAPYGHLKVTLQKGVNRRDRKMDERKDFGVHRLVAQACVGTLPEGMEVRHKNGYPWDNHYSNLAIGTSKENSADSIKHGTASKQYTHQAKLNWDKVLFIRETGPSLGMGPTAISKLLDVHVGTIRDVQAYKSWKVKATGDVRNVEFSSSPIVKIQKLGTRRKVFAVEVQDDHSHVTNGIVTHNSSRLSSSKPNMTNIPSHGYWGKRVKECFMIATSSDYASLEDRGLTVITQDPNLRKVYTDGYDGHSLRTFNYWPDMFPRIQHAEREFEINQKFYKVTHDDKTTEYLSERDLATKYPGTQLP